MKFSIGPNHYEVDRFGVVVHKNPVNYVYDDKYVAVYDTPEYKAKSDYLQALRIGVVIGAHGGIPNTLTDVGYGTGAFMKEAKKFVPHVWGFDLTGVQVESCYIMPEIVKSDVVCYWDALEHFHDVSFLADLPATTVVISLPYCHFHTQGVEWFATKYKHLKPSEHIRHFNDMSLANMMGYYGWKPVLTSTHEDQVRVSAHGLPNILTMAFKRK